MRSLLEVRKQHGQGDECGPLKDGKPCSCGKCEICKIFGVAGDKNVDLGPTRILVRDSLLIDEDMKLFKSGNLPMEIKYENTINRCTGTADHPRPLERVPAGVKFNFNIGFRVFENDPADLVDWVYKGLRLVELDALGGCGSRGCGEVSFTDLMEDGADKYGDLNSVAVF